MAKRIYLGKTIGDGSTQANGHRPVWNDLLAPETFAVSSVNRTATTITYELPGHILELGDRFTVLGHTPEYYNRQYYVNAINGDFVDVLYYQQDIDNMIATHQRRIDKANSILADGGLTPEQEAQITAARDNAVTERTALVNNDPITGTLTAYVPFDVSAVYSRVGLRAGIGVLNTTDAQHATLTADNRIRYVNPALLPLRWSELSTGQRTAIQEVLTYLGLPTNPADITVDNLLSLIIGEIERHVIGPVADG